MSRARELSKLGNINALAVDTTDTEVGIASTVPNATLDVRGEVKVGTAVQLGVAGVVTATSFSGSGSNLTGLATTETVRTDTLTVAGVSTFTGALNATSVVSSGAVSGTTGTFSGAVNVDATTDSTSSTSGALIVDGGLGVAKNVYIGAGLSVAGTLTYEDVTNVDSVGLITAKSGVNVSGGQLAVGVAYSVGAAGVATAAGFVGPLTGNVTGNVSGSSGSATGNAGGLTGTPNISCGTIAGSTGTFTGDVDIADKIVHTGDTDTAIRFSGADTISFETGGSARAFINSAGDFTVGGTAGTLGKIFIRQAADTDSEGLTFMNSGSTNSGRIFLGDSSGAVLHLGHGGNKNLNITQAGKTGIGKTNPDAELHVYHATSNTIAVFESGDAGSNINLKDTSTTSTIEQNGTDFIISADNGASHASSALVFKVDSAERARINSSGLVGINTSVPTALLSFGVKRSTQTMPPISFQADAGAALADAAISTTDDSGGVDIMVGSNVYMGQNGTFTRYKAEYGSAAVRCQYTGNTLFYNKSGNNTPVESMRINGSGDLLVGTSTSRTINSHIPKIQVTGYDYGDATLSIINNENNSNAAYLFLAKQRSGGPGGSTSVNDGDRVGQIRFNAGDGTDMESYCAQIEALIDDTPGGNDVPGRLTFSTTSNGQASPTERLRIDSRGDFIFSNGALLEKCNITAGKLSDNTTIDLADGMVHYFTTQESTTSTPNIRVSSAVTLNDIMTAGDVVSVTLVTTAAAGGYSANVTIDGNAVTEEWVGGSAPSEGGSDGLDVYSYTIICTHASNTGDSGFKVIANLINATN